MQQPRFPITVLALAAGMAALVVALLIWGGTPAGSYEGGLPSASARPDTPQPRELAAPAQPERVRAPSKPEAKRPVRKRSRVLDLEGRPVPGFLIGVNTKPNAKPRATAANGSFHPFQVFRASIYVSRAPGWVIVAPGQVQSETAEDIYVARSRHIEGRLLSSSGGPALGTVTFQVPESTLEALPIPISRELGVTTDAGGRFTLHDIPVVRGSVLRVRATSYEHLVATLPTGSANVPLVLTPKRGSGPRIRGIVIDGGGIGIPHALVTFGRNQAGTDAGGGFEFELSSLWAQNGSVHIPGSIQAYAPGIGAGEWQAPDARAMRASLRAGESMTVEVPITPDAPISGQLVDQFGTPLAGWDISPEEPHPTFGRRTRVELASGRDLPVSTDAFGGFLLTGLARNESYTLIAREPATFREGSSEPVAAGTSDLRFVVRLEGRDDVRGRILHGRNKPAAGVPVALTGPTWKTLIGRTRTDANGYFSFSSPPAGMDVLVRAGGDGWTSARHDVDAQGRSQEITLRVKRWRAIKLRGARDEFVTWRAPFSRGPAKKGLHRGLFRIPPDSTSVRVGRGDELELPPEFAEGERVVIDIPAAASADELPTQAARRR